MKICQMNTNLRLIAALITFVAIHFFSSSAQAQVDYAAENGEITITGYRGSESVVTIPSSINGLPVTRIGNHAFFLKMSIVAVELPSTLVSIGDSSFSGCTKLANITIPEGVTNIGGSAFSNCQLTNIAIPNSVTSLNGAAFHSCPSLTNVALGTGVANIGPSTFYNCGRLQSVSMGNNVTNIDETAFYGCTNLAGLTLPASLLNIGTDAFNSSSLTSVVIPNGVTAIREHAFSYCGRLTNVVIPESVILLGDWAFSGCTNLTSAAVPGSVGNIGAGLFWGCSSLMSVTMGEGISGIGFQAFQSCSSLASVTMPDGVATIGDHAFSACSNLTRVEIPDTVSNISEWAFSFCTSLEDVFIPRSVGNLGYAAFLGCTSLIEIGVDPLNESYASVDGVLFDKSKKTLYQYPGGKPGKYIVPDGVNHIANASFYGSVGVTSLTIPDSVSSTGSSVFYECTNLASVTMGENIVIGDYSFSHCDNLKGIYFRGDAPPLSAMTFVESEATLYYLPGAAGWESTVTGRPVVLWNPKAIVDDALFGAQNGRFGFTITGTADLIVVVEASANLATPVWTAVGTNVLAGGSSYFTDPEPASGLSRFFRMRSP